MFDRRLAQNFDWGLALLVLLLATVGLLILHSAAGAGVKGHNLLYKQMIWFGIGMAAMLAAFAVPYNRLHLWASWIYAVAVVLLVLVLLLGKQVSGSTRWLVLGPVSLQPSEFAKLAVVTILARYYAYKATDRGLVLAELIKPFLWTTLPFLLIVRQPDLGTAIVLLLIVGSMTLFVKIEKRSLAVLLLMGAAAVPMVWFVLKDYQKERIMTFLNAEKDPLGTGYHIIQSKIAIGSGMLTGKGYLKGTQTSLAFLPEQHTDFIFSVYAEEWGFVGSVLILLLFLSFIAWGLNIAFRSKNPFGAIMAVGITSMIFWQVFINIGMVMGLMPVVGVPLPFVSYGGSSVLTTMLGTGILMNVSMRRFLFD